MLEEFYLGFLLGIIIMSAVSIQDVETEIF